MAEGAGLLNRYTEIIRIEGSNPSPSAIYPFSQRSMKYFSFFLFFLLIAFSQEVLKAFDPTGESPIGDRIHVTVYTFLMDYLKAHRSQTRAEALKENELEEKILHEIAQGEILKTSADTAREGEIPNLLRILCEVHASCKSISLYAKSGLLLATTTGGVDYLIPEPLYGKYVRENVDKPLEKGDTRVLCPIYLTQGGAGGFIRQSPQDELIGFALFETTAAQKK